MPNGRDAPVVVGVDGSAGSEQAVRLGAEEASGQGRRLRLLHAFAWTGVSPADGTSPHDRTEHLLHHAADQAHAAVPEVAAVTEVAEGEPVSVLLRAAATADLIVVGDGGLASYDCLPTAAVAVRIAAEAECRVLIARDTAEKPGPVLVGIDGTPGADHALGHAFDIASHRGTGLVVVHVKETDQHDPPEGVAELYVPEKIAYWQRLYPNVLVEQRDQAGDPVLVLTREADRAALVVVGARGEQPARSLLGAVSMGLLHHAQCPVLVVRGPGPE